MSGQPPNIDPRLGASSSSNSATPQQQRLPYERPPPPFSASAPPNHSPNPYPQQPSPDPYYHYPPPQANTPQQAGPGGPSSGSQSNQASPSDAYQQAQGDGEDNSPHEDGSGANGDDSKRPRACEACRGLKVRCDQDPAHPEIPCRRCQKAGRQCIITAPSRKRQKKADSRVAELEKKLDALTAVLQQQQAGRAQRTSPHTTAPQSAEMMQARQTTASLQQSLSQYMQTGGSAAASPSSARPGSSGMQSMYPPQKRRRTEDCPPPEAESLDGSDRTNPGLAARYASSSSQGQSAVGNDVGQVNNAWGSNGDSLRNLLHRPSEDFMIRINSLVSPDLGVDIFNRYITRMAPHMPAVVFPPGTTAEHVWKTKPILYACILSAASSGALHSHISKQLSREAIRAIADCVVCNGVKSLELIQAMQVLALWYKPPEKAEQTNFYQVIHMAAVMAIDIGLGKRFNAAKARRGFGGPHAEFAPGPQMILPQNSDTIEARRAWLGCYYMCASLSMVLRRPNLIRWSNYMKECVDILETSPEAEPSDKLFCQHIKIQHICEDIGLQFLMDDNTATISITDPKVTYALQVLENDLKNWADNVPQECKNNPGLRFFEHVASLYLHEIALHFNHNIEDFRLPFTEESLKAVNNSTETLTQHQMAALEACRKAAHGMLDMMLSFDLETVKALPMLIFFVRCTYSIVILIKMHVAITTPGSEISKIMSAEDVRVDHYIDGLMNMFGHVANEQEFRPHPKILRILAVLKEWFQKHKENVAAQARGEQLPHPPTTTMQPDQQQSGDQTQYNQTPLHLLSQVATGNQRAQRDQDQGQPYQTSREWTFNSPFPMDHAQRPPPGHPDNSFPIYQQQQQHSGSQPPDTGTAYAGSMPGQYIVDTQLPTDYLWGTGFEQAMDLNLGNMDGLSGGGMDGLFLGGGMAPFVFNGDANGPSQW